MKVKKDIKKMLTDRKIVQELIAGKSNRQLSKEHQICHKKIAKLKKLAVEAGYLDGKVEFPPYPEHPFPEMLSSRLRSSENDPLLLPYIDWIKERLNAGWHKITLFEELPVRIPRASFYRFLKRHNLFSDDQNKKERVIPEIFHEPGESLILDWGLLRTIADPETGKKRKLWAFVGVLGYSRFMIVRLVWTCDTKTTIKSIEDMFRELGGVTNKVTTDNPKCFALEASKYEPILNPAFERFAEYYGFRVECLPPRDPQKKGKVERLMPFVRRLCEAYGEFFSKDDLQDYLNKKISIANERKHGTTLRKPFEVFISEESSNLKDLPALSYQIEEFSEGKARGDGHVRFSGKYYSIGEKYSGQKVFIIANESRASFYIKGKLIETHARIDNSCHYKSTKKHHLKAWERNLEDHQFYIDKAQRIGSNCMNLIQIILVCGSGFVDTRIIWGILSLDKKYSHYEIDRACEKALKIKIYSYRTVLNFIQNPDYKKKEPRKTKSEGHEFTRSLTEYQEKQC